MILIACTSYSGTVIQTQFLTELFKQNDVESFVYILQLNRERSNVKITPVLKEQIKKASLILLFVQPIPVVDWSLPHVSLLTTIYSFIYSSQIVKTKTIYISPFMLEILKDDETGSSFMKTIIEKSKLGHFEIYPSCPLQFSNPPILKYSPPHIDPQDLSQFYHRLLESCLDRIKKSV